MLNGFSCRKPLVVFGQGVRSSDSVDELQQELTGERELLQKACSSMGFSSGLKIIMSSLKNDDQWKICRPPFAITQG